MAENQETNNAIIAARLRDGLDIPLIKELADLIQKKNLAFFLYEDAGIKLRIDNHAVEIFPAQQDTVNIANLRHLWVMPKKLQFGWRQKPAQPKAKLNQMLEWHEDVNPQDEEILIADSLCNDGFGTLSWRIRNVQIGSRSLWSVDDSDQELLTEIVELFSTEGGAKDYCQKRHEQMIGEFQQQHIL